jgi:hypothetical protein
MTGVLTTPVAVAAPGGGASAPIADTKRPPAPDQLMTQRPITPRAPAAVRRASRTSYRDLSRSEAVDLAQRRFPALRERAYKALDLAPHERVTQFVGTNGARIDQGAGKPDLLMESELPLRTADNAPVDLSLRGSAQTDFAPLAPLAELTIDGQADEGVTLHDLDVTITPQATEDVNGVAADDKAFFADAQPDTDLVVTPLPTGVDLGAQLRSPESPEEYRWHVELPEHATLRQSDDGGAAIVAGDGSTRAKITAPVAWDADDRAVDAELRVDDSDLVVTVHHRGQDVRYPILLDPSIIEDRATWYTNTGFDLTGWLYTNPSGHFSSFYGSAYLGSGLYTYNRGSRPFTAGDYANWYFNAPGTSKIVRADFNYVTHVPQTAGSWPAPFNDDRLYEGVWSYTNNRYETGTWCEAAEAGGACGRSPFTTYGALNYNSKSHTNLEGTPGNSAIFGTSVYYTGNHADFTSFLGAASVFIADDGVPVLTDDSGLSDTGWATFRSFQGRATDSGLGLRSLVLDSPDVPNWSGRYTWTGNCTGDRKSRCPQSAFAFSDTSALPEGIVPVRFTATDVVGNTAARTWRLRIDRSAPAIEAKGEEHLDSATGDPFTTTVTARDGDAVNLRSGVRSIDFALLDAGGQNVLLDSRDPEPQSCDEGSCAKTRTWTVPAGQVPAGRYTIRVTATDQLGIQATETWPLSVSADEAEPEGGVPPSVR